MPGDAAASCWGQQQRPCSFCAACCPSMRSHNVLLSTSHCNLSAVPLQANATLAPAPLLPPHQALLMELGSSFTFCCNFSVFLRQVFLRQAQCNQCPSAAAAASPRAADGVDLQLQVLLQLSCICTASQGHPHPSAAPAAAAASPGAADGVDLQLHAVARQLQQLPRRTARLPHVQLAHCSTTKAGS